MDTEEEPKITLLVRTQDRQEVQLDYDTVQDWMPDLIKNGKRMKLNGYEGTLKVNIDLPKNTIQQLKQLLLEGRTAGKPLTFDGDWIELDTCIKELSRRTGWYAVLLQIVDICVAQFNLDNCITVWRLCKRYDHPATTKVERYITYHLCESISNTIDFFRLSSNELQSFLSSDQLHVVHEDDVIQIVDAWIAGSPSERESCRVGLYSHVRANFISQQIEESHKGHVFTNREIKERIRRDLFLMVGGHIKGESVESAAYYDETQRQWHLLASMQLPVPLMYHASVVMNGVLYVIGGQRSDVSGDEAFSNRVWRYESGRWKKCADMHECRANMSNQVVVFHGKIYVFGGNCAFERKLASSEMYVPEMDKWFNLPEMNTVRSNGATCVVEDKIYVSGGYGSRSVLSAIDVYFPAEREWRAGGNLVKAMSGHVMMHINNNIFVFGGMQGLNARFKEVTFRRARNQEGWEDATPMLTPRAHFTAIQFRRGEIIAIGGNGGNGVYAERFDGNCWEAIPCAWHEREGARVVLMSDFAHEVEELKKLNRAE